MIQLPHSQVPVSCIDTLPSLEQLPRCSKHAYRLPIETSAKENPIDLAVNVILGKSPVPCLLMVAGVHGNEFDGILAQLDFWQSAVPEELSGSIVMVPVANPPAFKAMQRCNPVDQLDMNRLFPGDPNGTLSHRLAYRLYHDVLPGSDFLLSMHGWHEWGLILPYVEYSKKCQVSHLSREAACAFGVDYIEAFEWKPGLLVEVAARSGIPAIEAEVGGMGVSQGEYRGIYQKGITHILEHLHILPASPVHPVSPMDVTRTVLHAKTGGICVPHSTIGQAVDKGSLLAKVTDLNGVTSTSYITARDGVIASLRMKGAVEPGDILAILFHERRPGD
jgi:predicted deacylase